MSDLKVITNKIIVEPEQDDKKYKKQIVIILCVFFAIFVVWGAFAKLSSAVGASGKVTVEFNDKIIQHLEGGIVKQIFVKDGDYVKQGQILIKLDETKSSSDLKSIAANYYLQLALMNRLQAEKNNSKSISFDQELLSAPDEELKQSIIKTQKYEFATRMTELNAQLVILNERLKQNEQQSSSISSEIEAKKALSESYGSHVAALQKLYDEKLIDKLKLTEELRLKISTDGNIASLNADKARVGAQAAEIKAQIFDVKQGFLKQVASQLAETEAKVADYGGRYKMAKDASERSEIKAPVAGYVVGLSVNTVGGVVPPGKPLLSIVPKGEPLVVDCMVNPADIYYVHKGLKVKLTFPSFAHIKSLKDVDAIVTDVGANAIDDPQNRTSYYKVIVKIDQNGTQELAANKLQIMPGMPVEAMILTGERSFSSYLMQPFENMFRKGMREQ